MRAGTLASRRHPAPYVLGGLAAAWALFSYRLGSLRHDRFGTFGFDLAIHDQAIWLLAHARDPFITIRGLDAFGHHFTPIYWLFAPIYWAGGGPHALLAIQVASQLLACAAIYLLSVDLLGPSCRWLGALFAGAFLLHPTSEWLVWEFFHPEVLALGPLLMAYRAARTQRWQAFVVWGLIAGACKEDALLALVMIGLVVVLTEPGQRRRGLVIIGVAAAAYVIATQVIVPWRTGGPPFYGDFYKPFGDSPLSVSLHFVSHPIDAWHVFTASDRLTYYRAMLLPAGLVLPLLGWRGFAVGLPVLFSNIATGPGYPYTRNYQLHYSAIVLGAVFLGLVEAAALLQKWARERPGPVVGRWWAAVAVGVLLCSTLSYRHSSNGPGSVQYRQGAWPLLPDEGTASLLAGTIDVDAYTNITARIAAINQIPPEAAVSAIYNADAHLAHRQDIYEWPNPWIPANWGVKPGQGRQPDPSAPRYLMLDRETAFGDPANRTDSQLQDLELFTYLTTHEFVIIFDRDGVVVAQRRRPAQCFTASEGLAARMSPTYRRVASSLGDGSGVRICPEE